MRNGLSAKLLATIGAVVGVVSLGIVGLGAETVVGSGAASAAVTCSFGVGSGPGTVASTNPPLITGAVAGSTKVSVSCPGLTSAFAVESSNLTAIVTPTADQANSVDVGSLVDLNSSGDASLRMTV